jgi:hypothetical protein
LLTTAAAAACLVSSNNCKGWLIIARPKHVRQQRLCFNSSTTARQRASNIACLKPNSYFKCLLLFQAENLASADWVTFDLYAGGD